MPCENVVKTLPCCCFLSDDDCRGRCLHQSLREGMKEHFACSRLPHNTPVLCLVYGLHLTRLVLFLPASQMLVRSYSNGALCRKKGFGIHKCTLLSHQSSTNSVCIIYIKMSHIPFQKSCIATSKIPFCRDDNKLFYMSFLYVASSLHLPFPCLHITLHHCQLFKLS